MGGCVGPTADLDMVVKRKILHSCPGERNGGDPDVDGRIILEWI
jgi:hypothetical protein